MLSQNKIWLNCAAIMLIFADCKKPFEPDILSSGNDYLVVTGIINAAPASETTIILSRTLKLTDTVTFIPEEGASISIETNTGIFYNLFATAKGRYKTGSITIPPSAKCRLNILTQGGKRIQSDFADVKQTPPIDSVTWKQDNDVRIFVNTHDPSNNSRYYWWDFTETWQYETPNETPYGVNNGIMYVRTPEQQIKVCWSNRESTDIITGSSVLLSDDVISSQPILRIPLQDKRINFRYSILVRQYVLTAEGYKYWQVIQKNSQQLGTLFDQQPAQLKGNFRSLTDPNEPVIGFLSVATVQEKRIFISHRSLNNWAFDQYDGYTCTPEFIAPNPVNPFLYSYSDPGYVPWYFISGGPLVIITKDCVDCTLKGGTNIKPNFW
jgi:Domain of unknown function (DUF4249)